MSQSLRGWSSQRLSHDENEVGPPGMMVTFTAGPAARRLTQFPAGPTFGGHDVRQFMQARLFARADTPPVVRADLHPTVGGVGAADAPAARNGYRVGVRRKRGREPVHLLNGVKVGPGMPIVHYLIIRNRQHVASQPADRQAGRQLRVIRCLLELGRRLPPQLQVAV
jgi:hypothetical protein